jgi:hypothetical protein
VKHTYPLLSVTALLLGAVLLLGSCEKKPMPPATDTAASGEATPEASNGTVTEPLAEEATTEAADTEPVLLEIIKAGQKRATYRILHDKGADSETVETANMIGALMKNYTGCDVAVQDTGKDPAKKILFNCDSHPEAAALKAGLAEGEYAVKVSPHESGDGGDLLIAATTYRSAYACAEYLMKTFTTAEGALVVPMDLDVKGSEKEYTMITSTINYLRDPCILVEDGVYYAYGTGWVCYKNTSGNLGGAWTKVGTVASVGDPALDGGDHWAPEVHKYNGAYYMFTTYKNKQTGRHGCTILKSDSPEGPFAEITGGQITPAEWDAIDGTLYVDPEGQPWMVFVHEWISMPDKVGTFAAAKLSEDLTHFISEPFELFRADEPAWAVMGVTDGCWLYTTREGDLLMLWSNFDALGYTVAVARSSNGRLDGEWIHEKELLYSKAMTGEYDGGHAMIFTDVDGQMYLSFHSPNAAVGDRRETPVFLAIEEKDGRLVWAEDEKAD